MVRKAESDDLYIFHSTAGLLKIGRSVQPDRRLRGISTAYAGPLTLVATIKGYGIHEELLHRKLKRYHAMGEWFFNEDKSRALIEKFLKTKFDWPFEGDDEAEMDAFFERYDSWFKRNADKNRLGKLIRQLKKCSGESRIFDSIIDNILNPHIFGYGVSSHEIVRFPDKTLVPFYTTDLLAARSIMTNWNDIIIADEISPLEICIAGLEELQRRL